MRIAMLMISALLMLTLLAYAAVDPKGEPMPTPLMRTVEPNTAKVGAEVVVTGDNLSASVIAEVYLMANDKNFKVDVMEYSGNTLKFKVPAVKAGAYRILVLLKSAEPTIIEEPVKLTVE